MTRTVNQNKQLWALVNKLTVDKEVLEELAYHFSKSRTSSTKELTVPECQSLINHLNAVKNGAVLDGKNMRTTYKDDSPSNQMRRKILSICHEMRWILDKQIDWKRLNTWLLKYGIHHKVLNDLSETELPATITQFEELLKHFYAKR